jgi:hypothetical protein
MNGVRGLTVCVEYDDLLAITLPRNIQHLEECLVVTSTKDKRTQALAESIPRVRVHATDAFYRNGAKFNKGAAIEEAFDVLGREGWILIWDSDILFPFHVPHFRRESGCLYTARRRILEDYSQWQSHLVDWFRLPLRPDSNQFYGYFQLFHATDPVLEKRPWYGVAHTHAGGGDNYFQKRWPKSRKIRPPFEVLHLGPCDANWFGRATPRLDGQQTAEANERQRIMEKYLRFKGWGRPKEVDQFNERVPTQ